MVLLFNKILQRIRYYYELFQLLIAKLFTLFTASKGIWLLSEKTSEARDNAYWLYKFIKENHPEVNAYFVIEKNSADLKKVSSINNAQIVYPNTLKHRVLFLSCEYLVCSQLIYDYFPPLISNKYLLKKSQKRVFLQHGIIKDNLGHGLDAYSSKLDLFIASSPKEQKAIIDRHGYDSSTCQLLGLCRFDNLPTTVNHKSHSILIMPTFRHWLMTSSKNRIPTDKEKERFINDDFFKKYLMLLNSHEMLTLLEKHDYRIIFYPHYCAQPFLTCFSDNVKSDRIVIASSEMYDVQELLVSADILITDYSSIFFDFAYMKKPEIFFQFDEEKYRKNHYEEGYFKYREHAFGPVFDKENELIAYLSKLLSDGCKIESKYLDRIDGFFAYTDNNNRERTYSAILKINKNK